MFLKNGARALSPMSSDTGPDQLLADRTHPPPNFPFLWDDLDLYLTHG